MASKMCIYKCYFKHFTTEVKAETSYAAQKLAAEKFKVKPQNQYKIDVYLVEKDGESITHDPSILGS